MHHETLNLKQAAEHIHLDMNELRHFAQRGEVKAVERAGDWFFDHSELDEWAQRHLLELDDKGLKTHHNKMMIKHRQTSGGNWGVSELFEVETISLSLCAKAKGGVLRDMTDLAEQNGKVYDSEALFKGLVAREEISSTAVGSGMALLHPHKHDPYLFADSFIAYGRSTRPIFFGAADGEGTRHFFLICATDHALHLRILARLAVLAHGSDLMQKLDEATSAEEVISAISECEKEYRL